MLRALVAAFSAALLAGTPPPSPAIEIRDPDLEQGVTLVKEGDFEAAVLKLDEAARRLSLEPRGDKELAAAYLYLGIAYLELDQELVARARFKEAATLDRDLRLDPRGFSPQVIRFFDAARQEVETAAKAVGSAPASSKRHSAALPLALAGGAAVAGVALAGSGGGTGTPSTTLAPTTTLVPPGTPCAFTVSAAEPPTFPAAGGSGVCKVVTNRGNCQWSAESTESWIEVTGGAGGNGSGAVRFSVAANPGGARTGRIRLDQDHNARCEIAQTGAGAATAQRTGLSMQTVLAVPAAQGQVVVNGSAALFQEVGRRQSSVETRPGPNSVEATLVQAQGRPGTWRFEMNGLFEPGSFRVIAGDVALLTSEAIVFRLAGRPGERVVFSFRAR